MTLINQCDLYMLQRYFLSPENNFSKRKNTHGTSSKVDSQHSCRESRPVVCPCALTNIVKLDFPSREPWLASPCIMHRCVQCLAWALLCIAALCPSPWALPCLAVRRASWLSLPCVLPIFLLNFFVPVQSWPDFEFWIYFTRSFSSHTQPLSDLSLLLLFCESFSLIKND